MEGFGDYDSSIHVIITIIVIKTILFSTITAFQQCKNPDTAKWPHHWTVFTLSWRLPAEYKIDVESWSEKNLIGPGWSLGFLESPQLLWWTTTNVKHWALNKEAPGKVRLLWARYSSRGRSADSMFLKVHPCPKCYRFSERPF